MMDPVPTPEQPATADDAATHHRSVLRRVVSNTAISLVSQLVTWLSTLFLTVAYARFLGEVKFGELYFAMTFVLLFGIPIEYGFNQQVTRDVAQRPSQALRYMGTTVLIKIVLWAAVYVGALVACSALGYPAEVRTLVAICGATLLSTGMTTLFAALHYSFEQVIYTVIGSILEKGLSALVGFFVLKNGGTVEQMAFILLGGSVINTAFQAAWFFRRHGAWLGIDLGLVVRLVRNGVPFVVYGVMGVLYYRLDTVLLSLITTAAVVGVYGAAYRLFDTMVFLPALVVSTIMYPVFSKLSRTSHTTLRLAVEKSLNFVLFAGAPIATFLGVGAPAIIGWLYHNPDFIPAVSVLQALAPGLVFLYINSVFSSAVVSTHHERRNMVQAGIALVFNIALNLVMIRSYGAVGAALVTSATEVLLFGMFLAYSLPRDLLPTGSIWVAAKIVVASAVMGVVVYLLRRYNVLVLLPIAIVVYLGTAALIRAIPSADLSALISAMRRRAGGVPAGVPLATVAEPGESVNGRPRPERIP